MMPEAELKILYPSAEDFADLVLSISGGFTKMLSELLSCALTKVLSSGIWITDRLLEMAWTAVMNIAALHSNVLIDVRSLATWNVLPYRFSNVVGDNWKELLLTCHKYQTEVKDKQWEEVKNNMNEIKHTVMAYITDEVYLRSIPSHSWLVLKTIMSLFKFIKAQQSIKESFRALEDLIEEPPSEDKDSGAEEPPSEDKDSGAEEPPSEDKDSGAEEPPSEDKDSGAEEPPSEDKDSGAEEPPSEDKDSGAEEPPSEDKDSGAEEPPSEDKDSGAEEPPSEDKDSGAEEPPSEDRGAEEPIQE